MVSAFTSGRAIFLLMVLLTLLHGDSALARERTITFSTHMEKECLIYAKSYAIMKEAFHRLGMQFQMQIYPGKRALKMSSHGKTDGEASRILALGKEFPSLVVIPEVQQTVAIYAYTLKEDIELPNGWSDISDHSVAIVRGIPYFLMESQKYTPKIHQVNSYVQQFEFVISGRADIVITSPAALPLPFLDEIKSRGFRRIEPPLSFVDLYAYLHVDNADLVAPLARVLREMKTDGTYERITSSLTLPR